MAVDDDDDDDNDNDNDTPGMMADRNGTGATEGQSNNIGSDEDRARRDEVARLILIKNMLEILEILG
jgi:hypothetical protein